jgi:hypothetical protein
MYVRLWMRGNAFKIELKMLERAFYPMDLNAFDVPVRCLRGRCTVAYAMLMHAYGWCLCEENRRNSTPLVTL